MEPPLYFYQVSFKFRNCHFFKLCFFLGFDRSCGEYGNKRNESNVTIFDERNAIRTVAESGGDLSFVVGPFSNSICKAIQPMFNHFKTVSFGCPNETLDIEQISTGLHFIENVGGWTEISIVAPATGNGKLAALTYKMAIEANLTIRWFDFILEMNKEVARSLVQSGSRVIFIAAQRDPEFVKTFLCEMFNFGIQRENFVFITDFQNFVDIDQLTCLPKEQNVGKSIFWIANQFNVNLRVQSECEKSIVQATMALIGNGTSPVSTVVANDGQIIYSGSQYMSDFHYISISQSAKRINVFQSVPQSFFQTMAITSTVCFVVKVALGRILSKYLMKFQKQSLHGMIKARLVILLVVLILDFSVIPLSSQPGPSCIAGVVMLVIGVTLEIGILFGILLASVRRSSIIWEQVSENKIASFSRPSKTVFNNRKESMKRSIRLSTTSIGTLYFRKITGIKENHSFRYMALVLLANIVVLCTWLGTTRIDKEVDDIGVEKYDSLNDTFYRYHNLYCYYDSVGIWLLVFVGINLVPLLGSLYIGYFYLPRHRDEYDQDLYGELYTMTNIAMNLVMTLGVASIAIAVVKGPVTKQITLALASLFLGTSTLIVRLYKHFKLLTFLFSKSKINKSVSNDKPV